MLQLTPEEINVIFRYTTNGNPAKTFTIEPDGAAWAAVAVVEYGPENVRINRFYFKRDESKPSAPGFFGGSSSLHFCGDTSAPLARINARQYADPAGKIYTV